MLMAEQLLPFWYQGAAYSVGEATFAYGAFICYHEAPICITKDKLSAINAPKWESQPVSADCREVVFQ